uniref:Uncharacterized protein n=1 Tax=Rhizophora mucronata TaxID=61149 RepID=A0A2P2PC61_RHIMU
MILVMLSECFLLHIDLKTS